MFALTWAIASSAIGMEKSPSPMVLMDAHQDILRRVLDRGDSLSLDSPEFQGSIPKWQKGGFNAIWFSVWPDTRTYTGEAATDRCIKLLEAYDRQVNLHRDIMVPCDTAAEVRQATRQGKIAGLLGLEGGMAINNRLEMIQWFRQRGVRYMTLTWRGNLDWAGSSQADGPPMGLTDFGKQVVLEMNRVGMIVDLSHVSDKTFHDALQVTKRPVIVSHSNARLLSNHRRNITDAMLKMVAANGGVVGVNFNGDFLRPTQDGGWALRGGRPTLETVVEQVDHIRNVAGIDHVGFGTDYDGGIRPAKGLETAAEVPNLLARLREKGYSESDIRKICGDNFLRVLEANEKPLR